MQIDLMYDRLLVKIDLETGDRKIGNIITATLETFIKATVIAVGHGTLVENGQVVPLIIKAGDRILISRTILGAGREVVIEGVRYYIVQEKEVIAKITE